MQGKSLCRFFTSDGTHHDAVLYGGFAKDVCLTDGMFTYFRQPAPDSWAYHHTMVPRSGGNEFFPLDNLDVEFGHFLKYPSDRGIPQMRWKQPSQYALDAPEYHLMFDLRDDPGQERPIRDSSLEQQLIKQLQQKLTELEAPDCQFERLGF